MGIFQYPGSGKYLVVVPISQSLRDVFLKYDIIRKGRFEI